MIVLIFSKNFIFLIVRSINTKALVPRFTPVKINNIWGDVLMKHYFMILFLKYKDLLKARGVALTDFLCTAMKQEYSDVSEASLHQNMQNLLFKSGGYSNYYDRVGLCTDYTLPDSWNTKQKNFLEVLTLLQRDSKTLCDIGANKGWFAFLAERKGFEVVAIDIEDSLVSDMYHQAKETNANLLPLLAGLKQFSQLGLSFDVVICLAVIHHLILFADYTLEDVFEQLAKLTKKYLVIEFVDLNFDERVLKAKQSSTFYLSKDMYDKALNNLNTYAQEHYSFDKFLQHGQAYFSQYHIFPSENEHRKIVLFIK